MGYKTKNKDNEDTRFKGKYGFIEFPNPNYFKEGGERYLLRKPTPSERKEIMLNYIIDHSGEPISVNFFSEELCVSTRTIKTILKEFKEKGLIEVTNVFGPTGKQMTNIIKYIGPEVVKTGKELTIDLLYTVNNVAGFRDFDWYDLKFPKDGDYYEMGPIDEAKENVKILRQKFLDGTNEEPIGKHYYKYLKIEYYVADVSYFDMKLLQRSKSKTIVIPLDYESKIFTFKIFDRVYNGKIDTSHHFINFIIEWNKWEESFDEHDVLHYLDFSLGRYKINNIDYERRVEIKLLLTDEI